MDQKYIDIWKLPSFRLVPEALYRLWEEDCHVQSSLTLDPVHTMLLTGQARCAHCNSGMFVMRLTSYFLLGLEAISPGKDSHLLM